MPTLVVLYDGDCPLCKSYIRMTRLRSHLQVQLIDGRQSPAVVADYAERGFTLEDGMVVEMAGVVYHGADAMWMLADLTSGSDLWNRFARWFFSSRRRARLIYPTLRRGRIALLWLLGRRQFSRNAPC